LSTVSDNPLSSAARSAQVSERIVSDKRHSSAASSREHVSEPIDAQTAAYSLKYGPRGAFFVAGISVALLFIGWVAFYFLLFIARGLVG
jgi:hypothetical protein